VDATRRFLYHCRTQITTWRSLELAIVCLLGQTLNSRPALWIINTGTRMLSLNDSEFCNMDTNCVIVAKRLPVDFYGRWEAIGVSTSREASGLPKVTSP
jgi:hypothetical protein